MEEGARMCWSTRMQDPALWPGQGPSPGLSLDVAASTPQPREPYALEEGPPRPGAQGWSPAQAHSPSAQLVTDSWACPPPTLDPELRQLLGRAAWKNGPAFLLWHGRLMGFGVTALGILLP